MDVGFKEHKFLFASYDFLRKGFGQIDKMFRLISLYVIQLAFQIKTQYLQLFESEIIGRISFSLVGTHIFDIYIYS